MDLANFDLAALAAKGATMVLKNPQTDYKTAVLGSDEKPVTFTIIGYECKSVKDHIRALDRDETMGVKRTQEERGLLLLAHITKGWSDNLVLDGKTYTYTDENAKALYARLEWIAAQVHQFALLPSSFFPKPPTD